MVKRMAEGVFSSLLGIGALLGGFYLLYLGFLNSELLPGVGGGAAILLGMWLITRARRMNAGKGP